MPKHGKKYRAVMEKLDRTASYSLQDAIDFLVKNTYTKFVETLECSIKVEYKSLQNVRGVVLFPYSIGRDIKVLAFCEGEKQDEAKEAGADYIGGQELIDKIAKEKWTDFDVAVATPDMMRFVGKLGPVLGRKGLMPKVKAGTVTEKLKDVIKELKAGRLEYRSDKTGVVHLPVGKLNSPIEELVENAKTFFNVIKKDRPQDAKGEYIKSFFVSSTMGPGIRINHKEIK